MVALFLALVIANGFIILRYSPSQFYKLHRYEGQLLYIKASFIGIFSTALAFLIDSCLGIVNAFNQYLPRNGLAIFQETETLKESVLFFLFASLISFVWCFFDELILRIKARWKLRGIKNKPSYKEIAKIFLMHSILNDSPLDKLLFLSYVQNIFLLITMHDRKVYVGRVISLGEPNEKQGPDQEISIVPVFSGYRDKDSLHVNLNTCYSSDDEDTKDIYLILKQDNIVSACEFVESLYEKFSEKNNEKS